MKRRKKMISPGLGLESLFARDKVRSTFRVRRYVGRIIHVSSHLITVTWKCHGHTGRRMSVGGGPSPFGHTAGSRHLPYNTPRHSAGISV